MQHSLPVQTTLRNLGAFNVVLGLLRSVAEEFPMADLRGPSSNNDLWEDQQSFWIAFRNGRRIQHLANKFLVSFVAGSPENQALAFAELDFFITSATEDDEFQALFDSTTNTSEQMETNPSIPREDGSDFSLTDGLLYHAVVAEVFRGNDVIVESFPHEIMSTCVSVAFGKGSQEAQKTKDWHTSEFLDILLAIVHQDSWASDSSRVSLQCWVFEELNK